MTVPPLSSSLPSIEPGASIGGGFAVADGKATDAKGADGKAMPPGLAFDEVLRQLGSLLGGAEPAADGLGRSKATSKASESAEGPVEGDAAAETAPAGTGVAVVVVPFPFLTAAHPQAALPRPTISVAQPAVENGKTPFVPVELGQLAPVPVAPTATPIAEVTVADEGVVAESAPLAAKPGAGVELPVVPATPAGSGDAALDEEALAKIADAVKKTPVASDRGAAAPVSTTQPIASPGEGNGRGAARVDEVVNDIASQLAARVGQPADERGNDDRESARDDRRKTTPAGFDMVERDRPASASAASATPSTSRPQGEAAEAQAETTNQHVSAAPAFAAHVALESPTAGPRLMAAPGFATHLEAAPAVMDQELPGQIVQAIRLQFAEGGGDAVVRLQPHFLGEVVVSIRVEHGLVTASLQSDTPAVRQWIEAHEGSLRAALVDQGLQLERLTVSDSAATDDGEDTARRRDGEREPQDEQQRPSRPRKGDDAQTFEVFV